MLTTETERSLRQAFARMGNDVDVPETAARHLEGRAGRALGRRRLRTGALGGATVAALAAVVAFGVVPVLSGGGGPALRSPAVLRVASYTLRLPAGYRVRTSATVTSGQCSGLFTFSRSPSMTPSSTVTPAATLPYHSTIETAASTAGGCIALALLPAYTPTATQPDPEALAPPLSSTPTGQTRVTVDGHSAYLRPGPTPPSPGTASRTELFVELPLPDSRQQDLAVSATSLAPSELVSIVTQGLASQ